VQADSRPGPTPSGPEKHNAPSATKSRAARKPKRLSYFVGRLFYWSIIACLWGAVGLAALVGFYATQLPPIDQLSIPKRPPNIAILAEDGTLLANRGDTGGAAVHLAALPSYLPKAFVAIEDRRFYSHHGIDPVGIVRAVLRDIAGHGGMQGGSTLTQQLAKNLFLTQERTLSRKIQEAILALWLEHKYSKEQILELYLNRVYFGSGAYGVEAASQKYFAHEARSVTLAEAAMLAGLMKAPSKLAPNHNLPAAVDRASQVIAAMKDEGMISEGMAAVALASPAHTARAPRNGTVNYAADYVVDALDDLIGPIDEDIAVTTTLDPALQAAAEKSLTDELDHKGEKFGVGEGALVAISADGDIRALVGGRSYAASQFDRVVAAKRQPGSAFKPFVYLAALEHGLTPDTLREDAPINVKGWQPENYSRDYFGPVTLTKALSLSLNTVAVRLGLEVGPKAVIKTAHRLGINSELQPNASIALGTSEVTPLELVTAYVPFANGGIGVQAHIVTKIRTAAGKLLYQRKIGGNGRVIEPQYVAMMNTMMEQTLLSGTARKAAIPGWQAAGKTGTSQDWRDAWFVGYTSHLITGVWLGNDDNSPTKKASGGSLPVEIWTNFMKVAHRGVPPEGLPLGIWHQTPAAAPDDPVTALLPNMFRPQSLPPIQSQPSAEARPYGAPTAMAQPQGVEASASHPPQMRSDAVDSRNGSHGLLPPEGVPDPRQPQMPPRESNFFTDLFGG
jgi:penicillin-binding protein 1A